MQTALYIKCPTCLSDSIKRNGLRSYGKQNYRCKSCGHQFIARHELTYKGCQSHIDDKIRLMLVRGCSIADIVVIEQVSKEKVLNVLVSFSHQIKTKRKHYNHLEIDGFWTFVGKKSDKQWLIYAYERETGAIVAYVWGKRDLATAKKLREKLIELGISYDRIHIDGWDSFLTAFKADCTYIGKYYTVGIEGNNNRLRHRIRRAFRKTCCVSKKLLNHFKAFELAFHYINYGWV